MNDLKHAWLISLSSFIAVLGLWQGSAELNWIDPLFLPSPSLIVSTLVSELSDGEILLHLKVSLIRYFAGAGMGISTGFLLGTSIALSKITRAVLAPWITALFAVPKIALLPLFILWLGTGESGKIAVIALGTCLPVAIYTWNAMNHTEENWLLLGKSLQLNKYQLTRHILLPSALPEIMTGLKIASTLGIILLTASEMMGSSHGIGLYIINAGNLAISEQVFSGIILLMLFATINNLSLQYLERRILFWLKPER